MKKADRQKVFDKYGGKCAYCGCTLEKGWHVDELLPVRRNYEYTEHPTIPNKMYLKKVGECYPERYNLDNQMPACASCNINKHSNSLEEFRSLILGFRKSLNERITQYKIAKRYGMIIEQEWDGVFYFEKAERTPETR